MTEPATQPASAASPRLVTPDDLARWLAEGEPVRVVDVLPKEVFARRHIPGAASACVYEVAFAETLATLCPDPDARVVVYGASDATEAARFAAEKLCRRGFRSVFVLAGGIDGWRARGLALEGAGEDGAGPRGPREAGATSAPPAPPAAPAPPTPPAAPEAALDRAPVALAPGRYRVRPAARAVRWTGWNPNGSHTGTADVAAGHLEVDAGGGARGEVIVDLRTLACTDIADAALARVLIDHLASDDFFDVERFPAARFAIDSARPREGADVSRTAPSLDAHGALELRGVRRPLSVPITLGALADGAVAALATAEVDRTRWGAIYGSARFFEHLGMHLVYDRIAIEVRVVLERAEGAAEEGAA